MLSMGGGGSTDGRAGHGTCHTPMLPPIIYDHAHGLVNIHFLYTDTYVQAADSLEP